MINWKYLLAKHPPYPRALDMPINAGKFPVNTGDVICPQSKITARVVRVLRKKKKSCSTAQ